MQYYWTPEAPQPAAAGPLRFRRRLGRFLTLSTAAHVVGAAAATWLSVSLLPSRVDESQIVRTIDFVEPAPARPAAPGGNRREPTGGSGAPTVRAPRAATRPSASPPARPPAASSTPSPIRETAGDVPPPTAEIAPSAEDARLAAATPKTIGSTAARAPVAISTPSPNGPAPSGAPFMVAASTGGDGPRATVTLPPGLVRGGGIGGSDTGAGLGARSGDGAGAGAAGAGGGAGVDVGDPDFSEYFRLIEKRVRAAWKFPEALGGTTQTVKIGFALAPEGSLGDARVVSSSSTALNESALSAMRGAAPFPPLPAKLRALAGQPLVISFSVTIR